MCMTLATAVGMPPCETADSDRRRPALKPPASTAAGPSDTLHTSDARHADVRLAHHPAAASDRAHIHAFIVTDEALHPIRRHYTPSVRVQRHVKGAAPRNGCSASDHVYDPCDRRRDAPMRNRRFGPSQACVGTAHKRCADAGIDAWYGANNSVTQALSRTKSS